MDTVQVNGETFEVETKGSGEPLVLIHGSISGEAFDCLLKEPALTDHYRVTHFHRRGFLGSPKHTGPFSIKQQAADALAIIDAVAGGTAHVAGHSYGAAISMQLAHDAPEAVHTLALFEPPGLPAPSAEAFFGRIGSAVEAFAAGNKAAAMKQFLDVALSPLTSAHEARIAEHMPEGWADRALADIDGFFEVEFPSVAEWQFGEADAGTISQPVLSVLGGDSPLFFAEGDEILRRWLPQAETLVIPNATHGLQYMNPRAVAEGLAAFLAKHPMPVATSA